MKTTIFTLVTFVIIGNSILSAQDSKWTGYLKDSIYSSLDNEVQRFFYYPSTNCGKTPLVVSLHQWGADYAEYNNSLAPQTKALNWNYIHPDFRGPNKHIKACGSEYVIADIDEAIDWAIEHLPVDTSRIYVVGASGGGYAALCSYMKSRHNIKEFSVWVPIADLAQWYFESKGRKSYYANNILSCTCECSSLNIDKANERSPIFWQTPINKRKNSTLNIFAGIHDGYTGSVPITHSLNFYNKIVTDNGGSSTQLVSDEDKIWLLTTRTSKEKVTEKIGDRNILFKKSYENISVTIFEGTHEILVDQVFNQMVKTE